MSNTLRIPGRAGVATESAPETSASTRAPRTCRPFGVADAMIATAAVAAGVALAREIAAHVVEASAKSDSYAKVFRGVDRALTWGCPILACLTLGWFLMRLRGPRPRTALLARQPGTAAALAAGIVLAPAVLASVAVAIWGNPYRWVTPLTTAWPKVGPTVAIVWLALFVTGRRRSERGWLDGTGRVLGALWIATVFLKAPVGPWYPLPPNGMNPAPGSPEYLDIMSLLSAPAPSQSTVPPSLPNTIPNPTPIVPPTAPPVRHEK